LHAFPPGMKSKKSDSSTREWYKPKRKAKSWLVA